MAKYTTEVRSICEELSGLGHVGYSDVDKVIAAARPKIFDFQFPLFDEKYRVPLENKILLHYYTREIGLETVGLWKMRLKVKLNEIMPYYNQLYKSELIQFNPMHNMDVTTVNDLNRAVVQDDKTDTTAMTDTDSTDDRVITDSGADYDLLNLTPQGGLEGVDSMEYLTEARKMQYGKEVNDSDTASSTVDHNSTVDYGSKVNTTEDYINTVTGKNSGESFSQMLLQFRETFLNIDMLVIGELEELFMGVW